MPCYSILSRRTPTQLILVNACFHPSDFSYALQLSGASGRGLVVQNQFQRQQDLAFEEFDSLQAFAFPSRSGITGHMAPRAPLMTNLHCKNTDGEDLDVVNPTFVSFLRRLAKAKGLDQIVLVALLPATGVAPEVEYLAVYRTASPTSDLPKEDLHFFQLDLIPLSEFTEPNSGEVRGLWERQWWPRTQGNKRPVLSAWIDTADGGLRFDGDVSLQSFLRSATWHWSEDWQCDSHPFSIRANEMSCSCRPSVHTEAFIEGVFATCSDPMRLFHRGASLNDAGQAFYSMPGGTHSEDWVVSMEWQSPLRLGRWSDYQLWYEKRAWLRARTAERLRELGLSFREGEDAVDTWVGILDEV